MSSGKIPTYVYVDGFNFFNRRLKGSKFKWLDLEKLCDMHLPQNEILAIKYFTAKIIDRPHDQGKSQRQDKYWQALNTLSRVEIIRGTFREYQALMPDATTYDGKHKPKMVSVIRTEEKASDASLAAHMVWDASQKRFEMAVLISLDSDFREPARIVSKELGLKFGVLNPTRDEDIPSSLAVHNELGMRIKGKYLDSSQFPPKFLHNGTRIEKPVSW